MKNIYYSLVLILAFSLGGCKYDGPKAICNTTDITFTNSIKGIMAANCVGCHGGATPSAGISLDAYSDLKANVMKPSYIGSIKYLSAYSGMPASGKLDDCTIQKIENWIAAGMPE